MRKCTLALSEEKSNEALEALVPEAEEGMNRVDIEVSLDSNTIDIEAEDTGSLRAALNSYLRWLDISEKITTKYKE